MADDTEEMVLIRSKGYKVVVDPSVVAVEVVPTEFKSRRLQKDRRAQGIIRVLLQNRTVLFNPRFGLYGSLVLPLELFLLAFSPFLLLGLGIVLGILFYVAQPLLALTLTITLLVAFIHRSNIIAALIDTELSGLIGTLMNLRKKDKSVWIKVRE
jgi:cellulose synthase/poly-beta-1,6-N-acetylglucosamine synthase-like glycosyltransferase